MNKPYSLTKSNRIILFIGSILILGVTLISPDNAHILANPKSEALGGVVGEIIAGVLIALFFPAVISWVVWRLRRRKENAGSFTFNILFVLVVLITVFGTLGKVQGRINAAKGFDEIQQEAETYQTQLASAASPEEAEELRKRYAQNVDNQLESLKNQNIDDEEKIFYSIVQSVMSEATTKESEWQSAFARTQQGDILDISVLDDEKAYKQQISVLMDYKDKSKLQEAYAAELLPTLIERVDNSEISKKSAKSYIEGMREANQEKQKLVQPLFLQHQKYADDMMAYLEFLYTKRTRWKLVDEGVSFDDTSLNAELNTLVSNLTASETKLNQMMQGN